MMMMMMETISEGLGISKERVLEIEKITASIEQLTDTNSDFIRLVEKENSLTVMEKLYIAFTEGLNQNQDNGHRLDEKYIIERVIGHATQLVEELTGSKVTRTNIIKV